MSTAIVTFGALLAVLMALHAAFNVWFLRRLRPDAPEVSERVSIMVPARNEQAHIGTTVRTLLAQEGLADFEVLVLDDGSTDDTAAILAGISDPRLRVLHGADEHPPAGWLGKPWACHRLAQQASGSVFVFADADVAFAPAAVRAAVHELRRERLGMVAPEPRELAGSGLERLVQPLLGWAIVTSMPIWWSSRSLRPSLSAANGQFLVFDATAYRAFDGHGAVRAEVIEDIGIMRACKRAGFRAATLDGSQLVTCRMYLSPRALVDGYAKNAWAAFNGPLGSLGAVLALVAAGVAPFLALLFSTDDELRYIALCGYAAGVFSRIISGRRLGDRLWPEALLHPVSILVFAWLNAESWRRHVRGVNHWKGRAVRVS